MNPHSLIAIPTLSEPIQLRHPTNAIHRQATTDTAMLKVSAALSFCTFLRLINNNDYNSKNVDDDSIQYTRICANLTAPQANYKVSTST
jgi:hypothetical protein